MSMCVKKCCQLGLLLVVLTSNVSFAQEWSRDSVLNLDPRKLMDALSDALAVHDEIPTLEKSKLIGRDQEAAEEDLDDLIEDAMALFESDTIFRMRTQYRELEERIKKERSKLSEYRSERVLALREDRSLRTQLLPGDTLKSFVAVTKADFDMLIEATENNIAGYEEEKNKTIENMSQALTAIGVDLTEEQLEVMMTSVVGDDIVSMSVVFNAIKDMAEQLAVLTQESGEDLEHAKKYYGMVVVLHRIMAHMQASFIDKVDNSYLPKLKDYSKTALANIRESQALIKEGGNRKTLENNIKHNEMTMQAIDLYSELLTRQRNKIAEAHKIMQRKMKVANNTYKTVTLSSSVVSMIREGVDTFDQLIALQMPDIREFQNSEIQEEFRNLTARLAL